MGSINPKPKVFLQFKKILRAKGRKTDRWVTLSYYGDNLGHIRFYPQWRCYILEPMEDSIWSWDCAQELSKFLKEQTDKWRKSKRKK